MGRLFELPEVDNRISMKLDVYVGDFGNHVIPKDVIDRAKELNAGKRRLNDRRTKGSRHIEWWGKCQDATEQTKLAIQKHHKV